MMEPVMFGVSQTREYPVRSEANQLLYFEQELLDRIFGDASVRSAVVAAHKQGIIKDRGLSFLHMALAIRKEPDDASLKEDLESLTRLCTKQTRRGGRGISVSIGQYDAEIAKRIKGVIAEDDPKVIPEEEAVEENQRTKREEEMKTVLDVIGTSANWREESEKESGFEPQPAPPPSGSSSPVASSSAALYSDYESDSGSSTDSMDEDDS